MQRICSKVMRRIKNNVMSLQMFKKEDDVFEQSALKAEGHNTEKLKPVTLMIETMNLLPKVNCVGYRRRVKQNHHSKAIKSHLLLLVNR